MTQLTIFVDEKSFSVDHDLLVDDFVQRVLEGRIGCLIFNGEDFLMKYHGSLIIDTELCDGDTLHFNNDLRTLRLPEGYFVQNNKSKISLSVCPVFKILESLTLDSSYLFPFDLIETSMLENFKIERGSSEKMWVASDNKEFNSDRKRKHTPHENFSYDFTVKRKIDIHLATVDYDISDILLETGTVMSGFYVNKLMKFPGCENINSNDKQIYSYTLDFLRIFLKNALLKGKDVQISLLRYKSVDEYIVSSYTKTGSSKIKSYFYFYHIGKEDICISADENRERVKQYLCKTAELTSQLPCYDGENIYANSCVNENRVYVRQTDVEFSESMIKGNGPKYIAAPGLKFVSRTKECREDEYSMCSWDYEYYIIVPEDFDEDEFYYPEEMYLSYY